MDDMEGIGIADIRLEPGRKTTATQVCTGIGIAELAVGGSAGSFSGGRVRARTKSYESNPLRKAKALAVSASQPGKPPSR